MYTKLLSTDDYPDNLNTFEEVCGNEESKSNLQVTSLVLCEKTCKERVNYLNFTRKSYDSCVK